jgi:hypothetical protein
VKRTQLKRKTPMARRRAPGVFKGLRARIRFTLEPGAEAKVDKLYTAWLRTQPCCAPGTPCRRRSEPHHPRQYAEGLGLKAPDRYAIPLCNADHVDGLHKLAGPFKRWGRERLQAWERERIAEHRARYEGIDRAQPDAGGDACF